MRYLVNLFIIFVMFHGEAGAMVCGGIDDTSVKLNKSTRKTEVYRMDLFNELKYAMDENDNYSVKFLAKEAYHGQFKYWSEEQKAELLFYSVENNLGGIVKNCADSGFDLNVRNQYGKTPLLIATEYGYDSVAEYLLAKGADSNIVDNSGVSALMFASYMGNERLVSMLIDKSANVNAISSALGCSPLSLAMKNNHEGTVQLLKKAGAYAFFTNQSGDIPMSIVLYYGKKLAENKREKNKWNSMARALKERDGQQEETDSIKSSVWSSQSFFRSFFRR